MFDSIDGIETQVEANTGFEARWTRVQTLLEIAILLVVAAGLAGAFGNGWLSGTTRAFAAQPLTVTCQRLLRANAPTELVLTVDRPLTSEALTVQVGGDLLAHASIGTTQPRAVSVQAMPQGVAYTFPLGTERRGRITFQLSPRKVGSVDARLSVDGDTVALPLFVFP